MKNKRNSKILSRKDNQNNLNLRIHNERLSQRKIGFIIWFFLAPGFVLVLSFINIMVLIIFVTWHLQPPMVSLPPQ